MADKKAPESLNILRRMAEFARAKRLNRQLKNEYLIFGKWKELLRKLAD